MSTQTWLAVLAASKGDPESLTLISLTFGVVIAVVLFVVWRAHAETARTCGPKGALDGN